MLDHSISSALPICGRIQTRGWAVSNWLSSPYLGCCWAPCKVVSARLPEAVLRASEEAIAAQMRCFIVLYVRCAPSCVGKGRAAVGPWTLSCIIDPNPANIGSLQQGCGLVQLHDGTDCFTMPQRHSIWTYSRVCPIHCVLCTGSHSHWLAVISCTGQRPM